MELTKAPNESLLPKIDLPLADHRSTPPKTDKFDNPNPPEAKEEKHDYDRHDFHLEPKEIKSNPNKKIEASDNKAEKEVSQNLHENMYNLAKWLITRVGPLATAFGHAYSAFTGLRFAKNFDSDIRKKTDLFSLLFSKIVLTSSCVVNGLEAFRKNRLWEGISRIIEPLFIIAENRVEDLGLARGIGLGISQLAEAQGGIYKEMLRIKMGSHESDDHIQARSMGEDHDVNASAFFKLGKEIFSNGFGDKRRFLTGFNSKNIKEKISAFFKDFNFASIKDLFDSSHGDIVKRYSKFLDSSGLGHIQRLCQGDVEKDKGHTTALSGYIMVLGSVLGYIDKAQRGLLYKLGGTLRNFGGMIADIGIFGHPDPYFNAAAIFLSVNTFMDVVQRFIPAKMQSFILPWSNISMATYNVGVGIYLNRSDMKTNQEAKTKNYDTDLKTSQAEVRKDADLQSRQQAKSMAAAA